MAKKVVTGDSVVKPLERVRIEGVTTYKTN